MHAVVKWIGILTMLLAVVGCAGRKGKEAAERAVNEFHHKLDASDFAGIYAATHPDFKKVATEKDFTELLEAVHRKLGTVKGSEQRSWRLNQFNLDTNAQLVYKTSFSGGEAAEQFVYRVDEKSAALLSYNINSKALIVK
jgi:hypothetical protein